MSESNDSASSNPLVLAAIVGAFIFIFGFSFYQLSGRELARLPGKTDQIQACVDKLKSRLNYPAETDFYELAGSGVRRGNIMIKFTARNDSGETIEHVVLCQSNGEVHIL